jgi:hypothetical protein
LITWILVLSGIALIFPPMLHAQLLMGLRPNSERAKESLGGKGEDWRDRTHFRLSFGAACGDLVVWLPLLAAESVAMTLSAWTACVP